MTGAADASTLGAIAALLLPWAAGSIWVYWLVSRSARWNWPIVAGHGYVLGLFITTLAIRLWDAAGLPLNFSGIASLLIVLSLAGLGLLKLRPAVAPERPPEQALALWQKLVIVILLGLIAVRYTVIFQEIILRPLYPWDAWMNWAPKAIVWFEHKTLVPFGPQQEWLAAPASELVYIEGARNAWKYPIGIPLIQLWGMLAIGTSDSTLIYLPWGLVATTLGLALFGHLALLGHSALVSAMACYLVLNLPFVNVHAALAGYADLWVTVAFGCAVLAVKEWNSSHSGPYAVISLLLAIYCAQLKVPGLIMGGIIVALLLSTFIASARALNIFLLATLTLLTYVFSVGIEITPPGIGRVVFGPDVIDLPYIGVFEIEYHNIHSAILDTTLLMINWNMLWYLSCVAFMALIWRHRSSALQSLELRAMVATLGFILFVYYFTTRYRFALDYTQVNRALIYCAPVAVLLISSIFAPQDDCRVASTEDKQP